MHAMTGNYALSLRNAVLSEAPIVVETSLTEAFDLGKALFEQGVPPDELIHYHHEALIRLATEHPNLGFAQIAGRIMGPLMEMSMAYGLSFRQQAERCHEQDRREQQEKSNRLESIGTLAAGIAHDFNNILGSIIGFSEMTTDLLEEDTAAYKNIQQIIAASFRARDLVKRMLTFARQQAPELVEVEVAAQIREALLMARASVPQKIMVRFSSLIDSARLLADITHIQQIIMNLCLNASDAITDVGSIDVVLSSAQAIKDAPQEFRDGICIRVTDNGGGMPPEVQACIFNPFFTTKAPGKGSGLGLSVVHGVVTQLGGVISVRSRTSRLNTGTEINIYLPAQHISLASAMPAAEIF